MYFDVVDVCKCLGLQDKLHKLQLPVLCDSVAKTWLQNKIKKKLKQP